MRSSAIIVYHGEASAWSFPGSGPQTQTFYSQNADSEAGKSITTRNLTVVNWPAIYRVALDFRQVSTKEIRRLRFLQGKEHNPHRTNITIGRLVPARQCPERTNSLGRSDETRWAVQSTVCQPL